MIKLANTQATINCSADRLYDYVTNMENYKDWFPEVLKIESSNDFAHGVAGKTYKESLLLNGESVELEIEVKQAEKSVRFYTEGDLKPILPAMSMTFKPGKLRGSCLFNLAYFSRNSMLEQNQQMLLGLRDDLQARSDLAIAALMKHFDTDS